MPKNVRPGSWRNGALSAHGSIRHIRQIRVQSSCSAVPFPVEEPVTRTAWMSSAQSLGDRSAVGPFGSVVPLLSVFQAVTAGVALECVARVLVVTIW